MVQNIGVVCAYFAYAFTVLTTVLVYVKANSAACLKEFLFNRVSIRALHSFVFLFLHVSKHSASIYLTVCSFGAAVSSRTGHAALHHVIAFNF